MLVRGKCEKSLNSCIAAPSQAMAAVAAPQKRLTPALIADEHPDQDLAALKELSFTRRGFTQIVGLDACESLTRVDLSNNSLTSLQGLRFCSNLKWLSVSRNNLQSLKGIEALLKLTVLNASHNKITSIDEVSSLTDMCALILNDNEITKVCKLDQLTNLNTLVLSHNPIRELGKSIRKLPLLKKLSMSYCQIQTVGLSMKHNDALKELRLAHNQIMKLPTEIEKYGKLQILDLGHNHLRRWSDIQVLHSLHNLSNLNLLGNPLCERKKYHEKMCVLLPRLSVLDGNRVASKIQGDKLHSQEHVQNHDLVKVKSSSSTKKDIDMPEMKENIFNNGSVEDDDDKPFISLINFSKDKADKSLRNNKEKDTHKKKEEICQSESNDATITSGHKESSKTSVKKRKRNNEETSSAKDNVDSGVVAVIDGTKKDNGRMHKFQRSGDLLLHKITCTEIGTGGPSTWDTDP